jgi:phosphate transport system substrate-binding protein
MTLWSEGFRRTYPEVAIKHESKSSSAAVPALVEGTAEIGLMSRKMEESEIAQFEAKFGYRPTPYAVAVEALAVYVHKDNPIEGLNMEQVEAIFAKSPRYGYKPIAMWGQLYLDGEWSHAPIRLYGRRSASGTYEFFKEEALKNGDFRDGVKEQPDAAAVVQRVGEDRYGLGYGGLAYVTPGVRALALADSEASPFVVPAMSEVKSRRYPLRRYLYLYVNQKPRKLLGGYKPLPPLVREFLRYVYSQEGQAAVPKDGYFPVEDWMAHHALAIIK